MTDVEIAMRMVAALVVGAAVGLNRDLNNKPIGMRTLALVSLGAAIVCLSSMDIDGIRNSPDAESRVLQGIIQGLMTGVGFIGAGVILRDREKGTVEGLTTATTVWVTAALGIACGLGQWVQAATGAVLVLATLFALAWVEKWIPKGEKRE